MTDTSYLDRRAELKTYFDRTAVDAWAKLTSDAKVSGIRATVRAGRDEMRGTLLDWLPADLNGARLLDAGCGTGMLAVEAARRGADVVATDLSPTLIELARQRKPRDLGARAHHLQGRRHARQRSRPLRLCRRDGFADPLPQRGHRRRRRAGSPSAPSGRSSSPSRPARRLSA